MAAAAAAAAVPTVPPRPRLATLLADDLGWFDTTITNPAVPTPQLTALLADSLILDRHCELRSTLLAHLPIHQAHQHCPDPLFRLQTDVYRYCSPTRRSLLSGRWPVHISGK